MQALGDRGQVGRRQESDSDSPKSGGKKHFRNASCPMSLPYAGASGTGTSRRNRNPFPKPNAAARMPPPAFASQVVRIVASSTAGLTRSPCPGDVRMGCFEVEQLLRILELHEHADKEPAEPEP